MIDEQRTLEIYGYVSHELSRKSHKPVVAVCECCGRYRDTPKSAYTVMCRGCAVSKAKTGVGHSDAYNAAVSKGLTGRKLSAKCRMAMSKSRAGVPKSDSHKTAISLACMGRKNSKEHNQAISEAMRDRKVSDETKRRVSAAKQGIPYDDWERFTDKSRPHITPTPQCVQINEYFHGCHCHHLTPSIIVHIPSELHGHIWHNLSTGANMGEMNALAIQFINGGL